jgi:hypothetical protein
MAMASPNVAQFGGLLRPWDGIVIACPFFFFWMDVLVYEYTRYGTYDSQILHSGTIYHREHLLPFHVMVSMLGYNMQV